MYRRYVLYRIIDTMVHKPNLDTNTFTKSRWSLLSGEVNYPKQRVKCETCRVEIKS